MPTKILVIEDAEPLRRDIMEMLTFEGYDVRGASNGVQGLNEARAFRPDLIVCDIMMPELDGYGVLSELQREGAGLTVPFIFLTARTDSKDVRQGMQSGADDYVTKPFTAEELISSVERQLGKRQAIERATEQRLQELRDSIILSLPHELRTPLTGIIGFSDILISDATALTSDKVAEMAQQIFNAAQRLYRLTENYLIYAQLELMHSDESQIAVLRQFVTHEPKIVIEDAVVQKVQQYLREADLTMQVTDVPTVFILEDHLRRLVQEVVDNALKFSTEGSAVTIRGGPQERYYVLRVEDHGRGMTDEQIGRIGAFIQFGRSRYEQQGVGFGLAIVQRLLDLYQGTMQIESRLDAGTTVTVRLLMSRA